MDIYEYIINNQKTFKEEKMNEIDEVILSLIPYIDFQDIVNEPITLHKALNIFLKTKDKKEFIRKAIFDKDVYKMIELLIKSKRYSDIVLSDYVLINTEEEQFGAISMRLPNGILYIGYEGTDILLSGWKEDGQLSYLNPIPAQEDALKYAKRAIKFTDMKVILGGHSKGGNLALYTAINLPLIERLKLQEIVSVDGPGLLKEQINTKEYNRITKRYKHYMPNYSMVGILLENTNNIIVKSNRVDIYAHSPYKWPIEKNMFIRTEQSEFSIKLSNKIDTWLENHNKEERKQVIEDIFDIFKRLNIKDLHQIKNPINIIRIIKEAKKLDQSTKDILKSIIGGQ